MGLALFSASSGISISHAANIEPAQRVEQKRTDLTGAPGMEVIASVIEFKVGEEVALHRHHGVEVAYVVQGAQVQMAGKPAVTLATGSTTMNLRDVMHGGFTVIGDSSLKLFTVHIVDKHQALYDASPASSASTSNGTHANSTSTK
ncbi:MAG: cupin domain-containing protein [Burkholderiales bacterium]|nr:cupin domain-containing protein [Burkholderiales bacterium]